MAGYVDKTLAPGEEIAYRVHFNWTFSFFPVLWFALGAAPAVMYTLLHFGTFSDPIAFEELRVGWWFVFASFGIGALILLNHMIILWTTEIAVTTYRFVYKTGLISRNTQEVSLNKIEEITLTQSVWGRIFGYGSLVLRGTGVGVITLPNIDDPIDVRRIIEKAKADLRRSSDIDRRTDDDD
ncbi:MAG TPA: PH domain-containing protein [Parvularculaceae bacterium]|nr:PH domain-containing protein [Parvularculaceae bacterium]